MGIPDKELGEQTCAFIQIKKNSQETEESLKDCYIGEIAKYKVPDCVVLMNQMPKMANGKINKKALLEYVFNNQKCVK